MLKIRRSHERGTANFGWLQSFHSFSFGSYYDPENMGVSDLIVLNDDSVAPGQGFPTHGHRNMEIISYVMEGSIEHKDSMDNTEILPAGEFQVMSAGKGVRHSEYNPSETEGLKFLQIWIKPNKRLLDPSYQQKKFPEEEGFQLVVSENGEDDSLTIHQDAKMYHVRFNRAWEGNRELDSKRSYYLHVVSGEMNVNDEVLKPGDGLTVTDEELLKLKASDGFEGLFFDLVARESF